jgi:hypothetical protein
VAEVDGIFLLQKVFYRSSLDSIIDMKTKRLNLLKLKISKNETHTVILSEYVLAKDWLSPEEDEAWKNL